MESTAADAAAGGAVGDGAAGGEVADDVSDGAGEGMVGGELQPAANDEPARMATAVEKKRIEHPFARRNRGSDGYFLAETGTTLNKNGVAFPQDEFAKPGRSTVDFLH